jgi:hypothetical protein
MDFRHFQISLSMITLCISSSAFGVIPRYPNAIAPYCNILIAKTAPPVERYIEAFEDLDVENTRNQRVLAINTAKEMISGLDRRLQASEDQFTVKELRQIEALVARMKSTNHPELFRLATALDNMKTDHLHRTGAPGRKPIVFPENVLRDVYFDKQFGRIDWFMRNKVSEVIIPKILKGTKLGSTKETFPKHILFADFSGPGGEYRMAYQQEGSGIRLIAVGPHENFYDRIREYVNSHYSLKPKN